MAHPHSSVKYVEPNYIFSGLTAAAGDGERYDRAPDLEDYCISLDIIVEISSRATIQRDMPKENRVIVMTYTDNKNGKGTVRFMSGTKVGGYTKTNTGEYTPKLDSPNVLTTYYADMHITDLVDYGTTEMLGIKSVDIDYNSTCVPVINIKFTDVRGMSIFQPSELNDDLSFNGIRGFSKDNIAQSFFHAFFTLPLPKFTITLKGFYGEPVSYQVMCDKFDTAFDSKNGCFDVDTRFIGYAYSFFADISLNALLAAPYSDYVGEDYWNSQIAASRFMIPDKDGIPVSMPRLYDIKKKIDTLVVESDKELLDSANEGEENTHEIEIQELTDLRKLYRLWYESLYTTCCNQYGSDYCYRIGGETTDDDYRMVIIFTNGKNITGSDLSSAYSGFNEDFRELTGRLENGIDKFNSSSNSYRKLNNILPGFKYPKTRALRDIWFNDRTNLFMFDGFRQDCDLPRKETVNAVFGGEKDKQQKVLSKLYNDGKYQYIDAFIIDLDYTSIKNRINALIKDANKQHSDKEKQRKALNKHMYKDLGWYPTIENFTKIIMAHLETLMAMMYDVITATDGRTLESLGIDCGDSGVVDVNKKTDIVAPFPRLTSLVTDSDGYTKSEDAWAGEFINGVGFREVDMVNGLFNGVEKLKGIDLTIQRTIDSINAEDDGIKEVIPMPLTSYDYLITKNPYGSDAMDDIKSLAGKICMRMFGILSLNHFRAEQNSEWLSIAAKLGTVEAHNFLHLNRITNSDIMYAIGENGTLKNGEDILRIVTGNSSGTPWEGGNSGDAPLFSSGDFFWLKRYMNDDIGLYPINGLTFKEIGDMSNNSKTPIENNDVVVLESYSSDDENFRKILKNSVCKTIINTVDFTTDYQTIWNSFGNAQSNVSEDYNSIIENNKSLKVKDETTVPDGFISAGSMSFNSKVSASKLFKRKSMPEDQRKKHYIPYGKTTEDIMYAGLESQDDTEYLFNGSTYKSEMTKRSINSYTLTECFGFSINKKGKYIIDKTKSLFTSDGIDDIFTSTEQLAAFFLLGIDSVNYNTLKKQLNSATYMYMPNIAALQIGAAIKMYYYNTNIGLSNIIDGDGNLSKKIPLPEGFSNIYQNISNMSPKVKIGFAKHFTNWVKNNINKLNILKVGKDNYHVKGSSAIVPYYTNDKDQYEKAFSNGRLLFNQESNNIKDLTNDLFSLICVVRLSVSAGNILDANASGTKIDKYKINESLAKAYLDAFMKAVREKHGITVEEENGGPTTIAGDPSQTTVDMKIELYRYLKQLHDKWVNTSNLDDWKFHKFFTRKDEKRENAIGNNFYFIDSFYNKIGDKLLINPSILSNVMHLTMSSIDTNVMLYNFMAQVFAEHRCMMKTVQNFKDLANGIDNLFAPVPYTSVGKAKVFPDLVVVYTYEPSRNLNVTNSEYANDGFMLNDEYDTPLPIKSRGDSDNCYKIPAFGVSYGRQYQSYFKDVNVNMSHPVITQQAIIAKANILEGSRGNGVFKGVAAQDLYDIYSNQSYTCTFEMMGCAYVQPLMYFVLLNIPFFKGSYLISKVRHRMRPGDMSTEVTGVRMSKYCNRMVTDMFPDQEDQTYEGGTYEENIKHYLADTTNDCPYKVYPIVNDINELSGTDKQKSKELMDMVASIVFNGSCSNNSIKIASAGIVGNMKQETGDFSHTKVVTDSDGFPAGGLCGWNDRYYNLTNLINNTPSQYGQKDRKKTGESPNSLGWYRQKLIEKGISYQITFLSNTMSSSLKSGMLSAGSPEAAAKLFRDSYEKGSETVNRQNNARTYYNAYDGTDISSKRSESKVNNDYPKLFFDAIQKSLNSTKKYGGELKPKYTGSYITITADNGGEKLAVLFDIILNSEEYYSHVKELYWLVNNSPGELPRALIVTPSEKVQSREILIGSSSGTVQGLGNENEGSWRNGKFKGIECHERLLQSLGKRYSTNINLLFTECPQFSSMEQGTLDKFRPTNCYSLYSGGGGVATPSGIEPTLSNGSWVIGDWNISNAIYYITHQPSTTGHCARRVEDAIEAGGLESMSCGGNATNLHYRGVLASRGFNLEYSGYCTKNSRNTNYNIKPGDIAVIGWDTEKGEEGSYHACMYTGNGWYSDFNQGQKMSPYGVDYSTKKNRWIYPPSKGYRLPYFIYRYTGKK